MGENNCSVFELCLDIKPSFRLGTLGFLRLQQVCIVFSLPCYFNTIDTRLGGPQHFSNVSFLAFMKLLISPPLRKCHVD